MSGIDPWQYEWARVDEPSILVAHPSHPNERHHMRIYQAQGPMGPIRFAAGEFSNSVWGFYVPEV